jgi:arabinogalactan endo-1,4-beta-galactosidase
MANINEAFPSNYVKAADLKGRQLTVKMDRVEYEMIGDDKKLILYFVGKDKGMVLNKTNANNIATIYGDETDDWRDQEIVLFEAMVDFQGKTVPAIRVKAPVRQRAPAARPVQTEREPQRPVRQMADADAGRGDPRGDLDDEIPF